MGRSSHCPSLRSLGRKEDYLRFDARNKREELLYRADVFGTRTFHLIAPLLQGAHGAVAVVPALGAALELVYVLLLARHARLRPEGAFQRFLLRLEAVRCSVGLGTAGVLLATLAGHLGTGAAGVAILALSGAGLGLGVVKDTCEAVQKGSRWHMARRARKAAQDFKLPEGASEEVRSLVERTRTAFLVKERRLGLAKTPAYVLMAVGQGLALVGLFTFPPLLFTGIGLAVLGAAIRIGTTIRDVWTLGHQARAVGVIKKLAEVSALANRDGSLADEERQRLREGVRQACATLPWWERTPFVRALRHGAPPEEVFRRLRRRCQETLGVSYEPGTGRERWQPVLAPGHFAAEMADALESGTPDAMLVREFCASFLESDKEPDPARRLLGKLLRLLRLPDRLANPPPFAMKSLFDEHGQLDRETFLDKMTARLPLGRHYLEYVPRWQSPQESRHTDDLVRRLVARLQVPVGRREWLPVPSP